jgi:hypothetical protein
VKGGGESFRATLRSHGRMPDATRRTTRLQDQAR